MSTRIYPMLLSFLGLFLVYNSSIAQQAKMLSNINQYAQTIQTSNRILNAIDFNNKSIQVQWSIHGQELWEYDGITPPKLILDINPGIQNGALTELMVFDNKVFFAGNNGIDGFELWAYDGINSPYMVADLNSNGNGSSNPSKFTIFQNKLYFVANSSTYSNLVWVYDGNTPPVLDPNFNLSNNNSYHDEFIVFDNQLFFSRFASNTGRELYRYDGSNPIILVQDIFTGSASSSPNNFIIYDNKLFFTAISNNSNKKALWMYDGTQAALVATITVNHSANAIPFVDGEFVVYNNLLIFTANDGVTGQELWAYDGTQVSILSDLVPGFLRGAQPRELTVLNDKLYFHCLEAGYKYLWSYNGMTSPVKVNNDINHLSRFSTFQNKLIFHGLYTYSIEGRFKQGSGSFLYDGDSTFQLIGKKTITRDLSSEVKNLTVYNNMLYFSAKNELSEVKLWSFNGLSEVPNSVRPVQNSYISYPENLTVHKDKLYLSGQIKDRNNQIWQYDGINGPIAFSDTFPTYAPYSNALSDFCEYQDQLFFTSDNSTYYNYELWTLNGNNFSAILADSIPYRVSKPRDLLVYKGDLYFVLNNYFDGEELWKYNGEKLTLITDISPNFSSNTQNILNLTIFRDKLYFDASNNTGRHIWSYDGTNPPLIESNTSNVSGYRNEFIVFQDKLYYVGQDNQTGYELWRYDGTNPPSLVADLATIPYTSSFPNNFVVLKNQLYFSAFSQQSGSELWTYDGTNPPKLVADIAESVAGSAPSELTVFNDKLYFTADDGIHGIELWEYNPDTTQQLIVTTPNDLQAILYPNPSNGRVSINFEYLCLNPRVFVVNANGQVVLDKRFNSTDHIELDLDRANAIYFIRVESEDGQCLHRKVVMN